MRDLKKVALGGRPTVGREILDLVIGVRIPASQPILSHPTAPTPTIRKVAGIRSS